MKQGRAAGFSSLLGRYYGRLRREVRETGELYHLLARAARRQPLTPEERRRMREQLIDVAKVLPALAIFAAPGGMLLLIALGKVLPFSLLPSAFREDPPAPPRRCRSRPRKPTSPRGARWADIFRDECLPGPGDHALFSPWRPTRASRPRHPSRSARSPPRT
ncbi:hypothetical protein ACN28S_03895 [Cystobacter fuscus]